MVTRVLQSKLIQLSTKFPFVTITGPRQSGKSTLARMAFPNYRRVSLEDIPEFLTGILHRQISIRATSEHI